ncbi:uncharacterized protein LJ264_006764 [Porphyrio hochstetteri]
MPDEATENAGSTSARVSSFFIEDLLGTEGTAGGGARRAAGGGGGRGGPRCGPRSPLRLGAPGCPLRDAAVGWYRRAHAAFLGCASPDSKSPFPTPNRRARLGLRRGVWGGGMSLLPPGGPVPPQPLGAGAEGDARNARRSPRPASPFSAAQGKSPEMLTVCQAPGASAPPPKM